MNIPMSHYRSAPPSPRVAMTHADAKPPAYLARLQQHIAMGRTPAEAMRIIEAADGHTGRLPVTMAPGNNGGRGKARAKHDTPLTTRCLTAITADWQSITDAMAEAIGSSRENIAAALRDLRDMGRVEHMRGSGNTRAMWRVKA